MIVIPIAAGAHKGAVTNHQEKATKFKILQVNNTKNIQPKRFIFSISNSIDRFY